MDGGRIGGAAFWGWSLIGDTCNISQWRLRSSTLDGLHMGWVSKFALQSQWLGAKNGCIIIGTYSNINRARSGQTCSLMKYRCFTLPYDFNFCTNSEREAFLLAAAFVKQTSSLTLDCNSQSKSTIAQLSHHRAYLIGEHCGACFLGFIKDKATN